MITKQQSNESSGSDEPIPKKTGKFQSKIKVDYKGQVHHEFFPSGQTVNKEYYLDVMLRLHESIHRKRSELWKNNSWFLHHDNAPPRTTLAIHLIENIYYYNTAHKSLIIIIFNQSTENKL